MLGTCVKTLHSFSTIEFFFIFWFLVIIRSNNLSDFTTVHLTVLNVAAHEEIAPLKLLSSIFLLSKS